MFLKLNTFSKRLNIKNFSKQLQNKHDFKLLEREKPHSEYKFKIQVTEFFSLKSKITVEVELICTKKVASFLSRLSNVRREKDSKL